MKRTRLNDEELSRGDMSLLMDHADGMAEELLDLRRESRLAVGIRREVERLRAENKRLLDETARHESRLGDLAEARRGYAEGFRELLDTMRTALADAAREIDEHNAEYEHVTPRDKLEGWRRLSSPDGEEMPAALARLDAVGADPGHPIHRAAREGLERKMGGPDAPHAFVEAEFRPGERGHQMPGETCAVCGRDPRNSVHGTDPPAVPREDNHAYQSRSRMLLEEVGEHLTALVTMLTEKVAAPGVRRLVVSQELGLRLGVTPEAPAGLMTPCGVIRVVAEQDEPARANGSTGLLADVLRLIEEAETAHDRWMAQRARAGVAGEPPTLSVLCGRLREVLGAPRRSDKTRVTPPG